MLLCSYPAAMEKMMCLLMIWIHVAAGERIPSLHACVVGDANGLVSVVGLVELFLTAVKFAMCLFARPTA